MQYNHHSIDGTRRRDMTVIRCGKCQIRTRAPQQTVRLPNQLVGKRERLGGSSDALRLCRLRLMISSNGGVGLRRPASRITLGQIYKAVESETGVFAMRSQVHEGCAVACATKRRLGPIFNAANDAVEQALSKTSLAELVRGVG